MKGGMGVQGAHDAAQLSWTVRDDGRVRGKSAGGGGFSL